MADKKVLIAYYSYSGNTKCVAEKIQKYTNGELFEIKTVKEYPKNYNDMVNLVKDEKSRGYKPELAENIDISEYDLIFVGTPVWWYTFSTPIRTFLSSNKFSEKTIIPFCTHGGGGASNTYTDIQKLCPNAIVKEGFTSYEGTAKDEEIQNWLKSVN